MTDERQADPPMMQRLYDRIWLLALAALVFWAISYLLWGFLDLASIPSGVILP